MKRFEYRIPSEELQSSLPFLSPDMLFVDIETTGFSAERSPIYLIGIACCDEDIRLTLYLAETREEEPQILKAFLRQLTERPIQQIVTFNGERFDLPYLKTRAGLCGLSELASILPGSDSASSLTSVDLYRSIARHRHLFHLEHYRQRSIEEFLGVQRNDEYDGGKLIEVYRRYEKKPDAESEKLLVLHNREDVEGMLRILPMLAYDQWDQNSMSLQSLDWDWEDRHLYITLTLNRTLPQPVRLNGEAHYIRMEGDRLKAALPIRQDPLKYYFPYPAQYVYLTREGTVVPKMLASTIPSDQKRPAKREECYTTIEGQFLAFEASFVRRHPSLFEGERIFKTAFDDDKSYIRVESASLPAGFLLRYLALLIENA